MKSDLQLQKDVRAELAWDPAINAAHVGVAAKDGVVTLTGHLETFAEKSAVQRALKRVAGVKAIALELDVKLEPNHKRSDTDIAAAVETAFRWHALIPAERIQVVVEKGWVGLTGEVDWDYQRESAAKVVRDLIGVVGVSNSISLKAVMTPKDVTSRIQSALARQAKEEAKGIEVTLKGATVTLRGSVHSWAERSAAYMAAWGAPGILSVVNEIKVIG